MTSSVPSGPSLAPNGRTPPATSPEDAAAGVAPDTAGRSVGAWLARLTEGGPVFALLVLFGLNAMAQVDATGFGILIPNIRDAFHMTDAGILSLVAVAGLVGLSMQVPVAQLADRRRRTRLMLVGASLCALFSVATGLAVGIAMLVVARAGTGIGMATVGPTHNSLLADWYPINARPKVYAFHYSALAVGGVIGPVTAGLLAAAVGWRAPFFVFAVPVVVLVVLGLRLREPIRGIQERRAMGVVDALETEEPPPSFAEGWRMTWKIRSLRRIFVALPFLAASLIGFSSLASLLYQHKFGLDVAQRGWVAAAAEPTQLVGLVIGARVGTRLIRRDPGLIIRFLAVVATACAGLLALFATVPVLWLTVVCNMAVTASLAAVAAGIYSSLSLAIPARSRSLGYSMGAIWIIPGLVILPIVGAIADSAGIEVGMLMMVPVFLAGGLILSTAGRLIDDDIAQVRTMSAARSEVLYARRHGAVKLLLARGLDVSYGNVQVLFGVDLEIDEGQIVALLGTNGAGKSTLLRALCGVVEADRGAVIFDGRDVTHAPPYEIAALGVTEVPGGQGVFPGLTVGENLRVAGWLGRRDRAEAARRRAEVLELFPVVAGRQDEPAANLSGGQQQMLALSMAFLSRPRLLLVDELSLGLAPVVVEQLLPLLQRLRDGGTTIVLVEQSVNLALSVAETAYFMEKGEIRFHGPTAELLDRPDILRSVFLEGAHGPAGNGVAPPSDTPIPTDPPLAATVARAAREVVADLAAAPGGARPPLEVHDVRARFGGIEALAGVSLALQPGEILGVIGPNGAGKTTLFDVVSGFTRPRRGRVLLDGVDVTRWGADRRARHGLGRSFQDARLFPAMTVDETLAVALERWLAVADPFNAALHLPGWVDTESAVAQRVDELVERFGLGAYRSKFVGELSTGTRRIVDLACLSAHRPGVVLLDEPSSGIAQRETEALGPLLLQLRDELGASLLLIEHDVALATAVSDRLLALDQGAVIAEGRPEDVLDDPTVVAAYLGDSRAAIARTGPRSPEAGRPDRPPAVAGATHPGAGSGHDETGRSAP